MCNWGCLSIFLVFLGLEMLEESFLRFERFVAFLAMVLFVRLARELLELLLSEFLERVQEGLLGDWGKLHHFPLQIEGVELLFVVLFVGVQRVEFNFTGDAKLPSQVLLARGVVFCLNLLLVLHLYYKFIEIN